MDVSTCEWFPGLPVYHSKDLKNWELYTHVLTDDEAVDLSAISVVHLENGEKTEFLDTRIPVEDRLVYLRLYIEERQAWFEWSYDNENYEKIAGRQNVWCR